MASLYWFSMFSHFKRKMPRGQNQIRVYAMQAKLGTIYLTLVHDKNDKKFGRVFILFCFFEKYNRNRNSHVIDNTL